MPTPRHEKRAFPLVLIRQRLTGAGAKAKALALVGRRAFWTGSERTAAIDYGEDADDWEFEYEWLCEDLRERAARAFPSLVVHDTWRGREDRILMRNAFADFGVSTYGSPVAVWIAERDDPAYWDADWHTARSPRARHWLAQISTRFDALFWRLRLPRAHVER